MNLLPTTLCIATVLLVACSPQVSEKELPATTEENCAPENVAKISDKQARAEFQDRCVLKNTYKPSPKRGW